MKIIYINLKVAVRVPDTAIVSERTENWGGFIQLEDGSEFSIRAQPYWTEHRTAEDYDIDEDELESFSITYESLTRTGAEDE